MNDHCLLSQQTVIAEQNRSGQRIYTESCITELYILWSELSWNELSPTMATAHYSCPDNAIGLVAQCELSGYVKLG